ncbi:DEAD-box ATP-dependent RNA helicase 35 [Bienertia sinuspersici]
MRACISTDITSRLDSYASIRCSDGVTRGYFVWYEDLSEGCAFCGNENHSIDNCPTLQKPKSDLRSRSRNPPPPPPPNAPGELHHLSTPIKQPK